MSEKERNGLGTSHESVWGTPPNILEMQKSLQKLGLTLTEDVLKRIEEKTETKNAFENDIKSLLSQNPPNPNEVQRLEIMWIQAYWKKLETSYGTLTFAEILKHEKREEIVDKMSDSDFDTFDKWMREQMQTAVDQNNEKKGNLTWLNNQLIVGLENLKKFKNLPTPSPEELRQNAKNVPELQWISETEIQSGAYDRILLADYYISHKVEIITRLPPEERKEFEITINTLSDTLGRERKDDFKALTDSLVLGEDRAKIESAGNNLIDAGYNREVAWDPQTRRFVFENALGEKRIIETARIPPQETIEKGILSLSQDIQIPEEKPKTTERKKTEKTITNLVDEASKWPFVGALPSDIQNEVQEGLKEAQTNTTSLEKITQAIRLLTLKANEIQKLIESETPGSAEEKVLKESLGTVMKQITALNTLAGQYIKQKNDEKEARRDELDPFHTGKENLERLDRIGLGNLGNMDEVSNFMRTLNNGDFANQLTDKKSINSYLMGESLSWWQYQKILSQLENLYIKITWDTAVREKDEQGKVRYLTTPTENGKTRLQNALQSERTKNDGRTLTKADFQRIFSREEQK